MRPSKANWWLTRAFAMAMVISLGAFFTSPALAKKPRPAAPAETDTPSADGQPATKAQLAATVSLASIKISRAALADDASLADVKEEVTGIYDHQESATKDALAKLRAAAGDKDKVAAAVTALGAADDEAVKYFEKHPETKDKIAKRATMMTTEIDQIIKAPADYVAMLKKAEVTGDPLAKATEIVNYASKNARKYKNTDTAAAGLAARTEVRKLLSPAQVKALDAALTK
jgi:hypothetical protein